MIERAWEIVFALENHGNSNSYRRDLFFIDKKISRGKYSDLLMMNLAEALKPYVKAQGRFSPQKIA